MIRYSRRVRGLAAGLSALAGFVDATGFIASGGFFVSFMSGNSTRLGIGLAAAPAAAAMAFGLILVFVLGVTLGSLTGRRAGRRRRALLLALLAALLGTSAMLATAGAATAALLCTAFAMGAENTIFETGGDVRIGLTYMTGNLVKLGQRLATALSGRDRWGWVPYLLLWSAMVGGAVAGTEAAVRLGLGALWIAAAIAAVLALIALGMAPDDEV